RDPGVARPRLALDHADLHRHRRRTAAGSLSQRPSAQLTSPRHTVDSAGWPLASAILFSQSLARRLSGGIMGAHESMEHAEHAEHASGSNKGIALLIAVIALFLALSEMLGKSAQTEAIAKNVEASNFWAFFQAKSIRRTQIQTAAEQGRLTLGTTTDEAAKAALAKQIDAWDKTAARYRSEPETGEGSEQLAKRAKESEAARDV